jgi:hypothetical protein
VWRRSGGARRRAACSVTLHLPRRRNRLRRPDRA